MSDVPRTFGESHRAVVTGGAGFIGSHLVDALVARGLEVTVIDDLSSGSPANLPAGIRLIEADVASPSIIDVVKDARPDLVIHAAAQVSVPRSVADPARDRAVNTVGTEHVIRGARASGAARLVYISSGGAVYGEASGATESTMPKPLSPYGEHKLAAETRVRECGVSYGIVRYSNVYGPRQRPGLEGGVVAIFLEACRSHEPVTVHGDGRQVRDFLYVDDAVAGALAVAGAEHAGTWNVATNRPVSVMELLDAIEALIGRRCSSTFAPARDADVRASSLAIDRVREDFGWEPLVPLEEGLRRTLRAGTSATAGRTLEA